MSTHDLAWAAGFFDGEGHVRAVIDRRPGKYRSGRHVSLELTVVQCGEAGSEEPPEILLRWGRATGERGKVYRRGKNNPSHWRPTWAYTVTHPARTLEVLDLLRPWLGAVKLAQADEAIETYRSFLNPVPNGRTHCRRGHEFTPENTGVRIHKSTGRPYRWCRTCYREDAPALNAERRATRASRAPQEVR